MAYLIKIISSLWASPYEWEARNEKVFKIITLIGMAIMQKIQMAHGGSRHPRFKFCSRNQYLLGLHKGSRHLYASSVAELCIKRVKN